MIGQCDWIEIAAVSIICLTTLIPVWHGLAHPVRCDEAATGIRFVFGHPLAAWLNYSDTNNHILHSLAAKVSVAFFGENLYALRVPAALAGFLCVPLLFIAIRSMLGRQAGLIAIAFWAALPWVVDLATNARGYTMLLVCELALIPIIPRLARGRPGSALLAGLLMALGLGCVPVFLLPLAGIGVWGLGLVIRNFLWLGPTAAYSGLKAALAASALCCVGVFAIYGPALVYTSSGAEMVDDLARVKRAKPLDDFGPIVGQVIELAVVWPWGNVGLAIAIILSVAGCIALVWQALLWSRINRANRATQTSSARRFDQFPILLAFGFCVAAIAFAKAGVLLPRWSMSVYLPFAAILLSASAIWLPQGRKTFRILALGCVLFHFGQISRTMSLPWTARPYDIGYLDVNQAVEWLSNQPQLVAAKPSVGLAAHALAWLPISYELDQKGLDFNDRTWSAKDVFEPRFSEVWLLDYSRIESSTQIEQLTKAGFVPDGTIETFPLSRWVRWKRLTP